MTQLVARWNTLTYHAFRICYAVLWHLRFVIGLEIQMKKNWISNFMFYKNLIVNVFFSVSESNVFFRVSIFFLVTTLSVPITSMSLLLKAIQVCIKKYQQTERVCGFETKHKSYSRFSTSVQSCSVVLPHQQSSLTPLTTWKSASLRHWVDTVENMGFFVSFFFF